MTSYTYLGRDYEYFDVVELINKSNHYSEIFDEFINDIVENIDQYIDNEIYTGWCYNMKDYNVNKNNDGIKLNLIIEDLSYKQKGYINPDRFPDITIHLNKLLLNDIHKIKSTLLHELTHVIKVYIKNRNELTTIKETLTEEIYTFLSEFDITIDDKKKKKRLIDLLYDIFYIITSNEQLATINETCKYLDSIDIKNVQNILKSYLNKCVNDGMRQLENNVTMVTKSAQIYNILNYLHEYHFLNLMDTINDKFNDLIIPVKLLIAYYLNKHGYIKNPKLHYITYDIVYSSVHSGSKYKISKNIEDELYHVYECIYNNFEKYKKKLYDAVYMIMEKKNMFLPIDEVYEIVPYHFKRLLEQEVIEY